jgi:tRNA pseudouridine38-40 synthase
MRNLRLEIEYDGTNYCGWQVQNSPLTSLGTPFGRRLAKSIQEVIEKSLQKILQEKIRLIASGRTDAGVHAQGQVANFKTNSNITLEKLKRALNGLLPDDIAISKVKKVDLDFHSRFDAKSKIYRYAILNRAYPSALLRNKVYFYPYPLDIKLMRQEAHSLLGRHDFKAFCASGSNAKNTMRTIKKIEIKKTNWPLTTGHWPLITIDIEADGFLYNMARNIVGTFIEIARAKFPKGSLRKILLHKDRQLAGPTVPAHGLCLLKVKY